LKTKQAALDWCGDYFRSGRFQDDLSNLVAFKSESQNPDQHVALTGYLMDGVGPMLDALGFACEIFDNDPHAPIMIAERVEAAGLPTVLCYGHGDVINGMEETWTQGLSPYAVTVREGRLYGRGTADNKGQHLINMAALRALIETQGHLGFNMRFLIEMGEEVGSPGLADFCAAHREKVQADVLIASDGPRLSPETPTLFTGARGAETFDLIVDFDRAPCHSGNFGGLRADPAIVLAHALASITDARGQIAVPEWRPTSLSDEVRAHLATLPAPGAGLKTDPDWGEADLTQAERVYGWNSFCVLALSHGTPETPQNAIAGYARATCQLRYVVGTDPDDIVPALRRHLDAAGFPQVLVKPSGTARFSATRLPLDNPWLTFARDSVEGSTGTAPHVLPNLGGSLPNEIFAETLGLPTIWIPHSYAGCGQHGPDEHMLTSVAEEGLNLMAALFWDIGETGGPAR
jgi:acetylornithine deacetylase/succinyl-diaminopimelate desuccinylase-like protein